MPWIDHMQYKEQEEKIWQTIVKEWSKQHGATIRRIEGIPYERGDECFETARNVAYSDYLDWLDEKDRRPCIIWYQAQLENPSGDAIEEARLITLWDRKRRSYKHTLREAFERHRHELIKRGYPVVDSRMRTYLEYRQMNGGFPGTGGRWIRPVDYLLDEELEEIAREHDDTLADWKPLVGKIDYLAARDYLRSHAKPLGNALYNDDGAELREVYLQSDLNRAVTAVSQK